MGLKMYFCVGSWVSALSQVPPVQRSELGTLVLSHCAGPGNWTDWHLSGNHFYPVWRQARSCLRNQTTPSLYNSQPRVAFSREIQNCKGKLTSFVHKKRKRIFKITALKQKAQASSSWLLEAKISKNILKGIAEKSQLVKYFVSKRTEFISPELHAKGWAHV